MNLFKSTLLLTLMTGLLLLLGRAFGGEQGMLMALLFAGVMNFVTYFYSDKIALRANRAVPLPPEYAYHVTPIMQRLTQKQGLPMPQLYLLPDNGANAFATGRNPKHASVAVTQGILALLTDDELEGVLAHELSHVRNRDILTASIAATLAGAITWIAHIGRWGMIFGGYGGGNSRDRNRGGNGLIGIVMLLFAPIAALLIQMWVSRTREFEADAGGAALTGNPNALARALEKISGYSAQVPTFATASSAHLFINAPRITGTDFANLFSTHPPMAKRIEKLTGRPYMRGTY